VMKLPACESGQVVVPARPVVDVAHRVGDGVHRVGDGAHCREERGERAAPAPKALAVEVVSIDRISAGVLILSAASTVDGVFLEETAGVSALTECSCRGLIRSGN
jgi:hypothetical protein